MNFKFAPFFRKAEKFQTPKDHQSGTFPMPPATCTPPSVASTPADLSSHGSTDPLARLEATVAQLKADLAYTAVPSTVNPLIISELPDNIQMLAPSRPRALSGFNFLSRSVPAIKLDSALMGSPYLQYGFTSVTDMDCRTKQFKNAYSHTDRSFLDMKFNPERQPERALTWLQHIDTHSHNLGFATSIFLMQLCTEGFLNTSITYFLSHPALSGMSAELRYACLFYSAAEFFLQSPYVNAAMLIHNNVKARHGQQATQFLTELVDTYSATKLRRPTNAELSTLLGDKFLFGLSETDRKDIVKMPAWQHYHKDYDKFQQEFLSVDFAMTVTPVSSPPPSRGGNIPNDAARFYSMQSALPANPYHRDCDFRNCGACKSLYNAYVKLQNVGKELPRSCCLRCITTGDHSTWACHKDIQWMNKRCMKCGGVCPDGACTKSHIESWTCQRCNHTGHDASVCPALTPPASPFSTKRPSSNGKRRRPS